LLSYLIGHPSLKGHLKVLKTKEFETANEASNISWTEAFRRIDTAQSFSNPSNKKLDQKEKKRGKKAGLKVQQSPTDLMKTFIIENLFERLISAKELHSKQLIGWLPKNWWNYKNKKN